MTRTAIVALLTASMLCGCGRVGFGPEPPQSADGGADASLDADTDASLDGGTDASLDAGMDASSDASADAPADSAVDAPVDAAMDAPVDAGTDAPVDAGMDSGPVTYACDTQTDIPPSECRALVALYESTNGPGWFSHTGWLATGPCDWEGVFCVGGQVGRLVQQVNQLNGPIPPELGNLTNLTTLYLSANQLSGPIPPELGNLTNMTNLSLRNNRLSGAIPSELGNLTAATEFNLSNNQLSGEVPPSLMSIPVGPFSNFLRGNGCLTATGAAFIAWLNGRDPAWNDGC